jgi:hypothetical protein
MKPDTGIQRRPDGSIDTDHYMTHGRNMRAQQVLNLTAALASRATPRSLRMAISAGIARIAPGVHTGTDPTAGK